jgi:uncharacterized protein (TIGR00297 family)
MLVITLLNMFLLPRLASGKKMTRPKEGFVNGIWMYPLALAICFAAFPPFAAMGAWAAMASGDAAAALVGRNLPRPKLPWNQKKSWSGLFAFVAAALPLCIFAIYWCPSVQFLKADGSPEWPFVWTLAVLAAVSGAVVESFDGPFDDNLRVPITVASVLWLSGMFLSFATRKLPADTPVQPEVFLKALAFNAVLGFSVIALKVADIPGTLLGVTFGVIIFFFTQWPGYILFLLFVAVGSGLSKIGYQHKKEIGAAEAREGKRGIANVAANLFVPALCCLIYPASGGNPALLMAFAGALVAAFADTASSEIGALAHGEPKLITNFKAVPHGTNGAVTGLGFAAAVGACLTLSGIAWWNGFLEQQLSANGFSSSQGLAACGILTLAGLLGTVIDSVLGATIEDRIPGVGKGVVNFACTLTGALTSGLLTHLFWR